MKTKALTVVCLTTLLFSHASFSGWGQASLYKESELNLNTDGLKEFSVDVGAGDIEIKGQASASEIRVEAKVYGKRIDEDDYTLSLSEKGKRAVLEAFFNGESRNGERIDLVVYMPSSLHLMLDDRSGDIWVNSLHAGLEINDRSGDIELRDVKGGVKVEDRSGDLVASQLEGDVTVADRSGDIHLKDLDGDLTIDDSSGDVYVKNATGSVTVDDSSGDIRVNGAASFKLKGDGSGDVVLRNVESR